VGRGLKMKREKLRKRKGKEMKVERKGKIGASG
jgi:hypothetical protein